VFLDLLQKTLQLQQYGSDKEEVPESGIDFGGTTSHLKPLASGKSFASLQTKMQICSAPDDVLTTASESLRHIDSVTKEVMYNPKYEELFAPDQRTLFRRDSSMPIKICLQVL
jgi:pre-mRNA-processing factor 17